MSITKTFRAMLEADASRPLDQQNGEAEIIPGGTPLQDPVGGDGGDSHALRAADQMDGEEGMIPSGTEIEQPEGGDDGDTHADRPADVVGVVGGGEPSATQIDDPLAAMEMGMGTEVQGNTDTHQGRGELKESGEDVICQGAPVETPMGASGEDTHELRQADQNNPGEDIIPSQTQVQDPLAAIEMGMGTEVQGNTDTHQGEGELAQSVCERVMEAVSKDVNFKVTLGESVKGLFEAQELSEEFAAEAIEIFEAVVNNATKSHIKTINEAVGTIVESELEKTITAMEEATEKYLDLAIAEWVQDNEVAIQKNYRTAVAESFMNGMKELLEAHYVDLPTHKEDLYEAAVSKGDEILQSLTESENQVAELQEELQNLKKERAVDKFVAEMTMVDADRIRSLAEDMSFTESFERKLTVLAEGLQTPKARKSTMVVEDASPLIEEDKPIFEGDEEVSRLAGEIGRFAPNK